MRTSGKGQSRKTASAEKSTTWRGRKPKVLVGTLSQTPFKGVRNVVSDGRCISENPYFVAVMERSVVIDPYELVSFQCRYIIVY